MEMSPSPVVPTTVALRRSRYAPAFGTLIVAVFENHAAAAEVCCCPVSVHSVVHVVPPFVDASNESAPVELPYM